MELKTELNGFGWKSKIQERRNSNFVTIPQFVIRGNFLKKGDDLFYYSGKLNDRNAIIILLDTKPLDEDDKIICKQLKKQLLMNPNLTKKAAKVSK